MTLLSRSLALLRGGQGLALGFSRRLPLVYLVWGISVGLAVAWITPPWQVPDEPNHFLRMVQVSSGEMTGRSFATEGFVGGKTDPAILASILAFGEIPFHPDRKDTQLLEQQARQWHWSGQSVPLPFGNTAIYPPAFYLPGALALIPARLAALGIVTSLLLVRAVNVVIGSILIAIGLRLSGRTRPALLALAALPMTVSLMASASQDSLLLPAILLAVGWIDRLVAENRPPTRGELGVLTVLLALSAMARPTHLFLLGLVVLACPRRRGSVWAVGLGACCVLGWIALTFPIMPSYSWSDPGAQLRFLLAHPLDIPRLAIRTLQVYGPGYPRQFVGHLGWLDAELPLWFCRMAWIVLGGAFLSVAAGAAWRPRVAVVVVLLGIAATFAAEYLTWTPVGKPVIEGVQGRYFLPFATVLALAVPGFPAVGRRVLPWALAGVLVLMLLAPPVMLRSLVLRYYLG